MSNGEPQWWYDWIMGRNGVPPINASSLDPICWPPEPVPLIPTPLTARPTIYLNSMTIAPWEPPRFSDGLRLAVAELLTDGTEIAAWLVREMIGGDVQ